MISIPNCTKKFIHRYSIIFFFFFTVVFTSLGQEVKPFDFNFTKADTAWADSVMNTLSPRDRIAQLFMIRVLSNQNEKYIQSMGDFICDWKPGGICFFKGGPVRQARITNYFQSFAQTPLFISLDAEWGLSMRLDSTLVFPRQMTLGAVQNDSLLYLMGEEIARECRRIGVHINFAPDIDVNSNRNNPVINTRSFGENKNKVAEKGIVYMDALQKNGVMACAKHFPGHGDTDTDSHKALPIIHHSAEKIDSLDLYPFKQLFKSGVSSAMIAHLYIPALDTAKNRASTLSRTIVTDILKTKLGFKGLVFTDAMDMKGVSKFYKNGIAELKAVQAGNDFILLPANMHNAVMAIQRAIDSCEYSQQAIDSTCRKILIFKHKMGLGEMKPIEINSIDKDLNTPHAQLLQQKIYESAITLVKNKNDILPLKRPDHFNIAQISIGDTNQTVFQKTLSNYGDIDFYNMVENPTQKYADSILKVLSKYEVVIASIHKTWMYPSYNVRPQTVQFIDSLQRKTRVILDIMGNPYALDLFKETELLQAIVVSYQANAMAENVSAQLMMGAGTYSGKLPVTVTQQFHYNTGIQTKDLHRLEYTMPEELGINSCYLQKVDSIAQGGINKKAYPGCQVLLVKDGKVFYRKSFGYHTYLDKTPVEDDDIYDMASITKLEATTAAIMKLSDEGKINLDAKLGKYLPIVKGSNKESLIIRDILAHQAKLQAWIPFYLKTIHHQQPDTDLYQKIKSDRFSIMVADSMFMRSDYRDTILEKIIASPLSKKKEYVYSDMGFYLFKEMIEKITKQDFESYLSSSFYKPLGMNHTLFNPLRKFELKSINPTENDTIFRKQIVHGFVHDPGAAMMGGVEGHAGLFSNANDLAIFLQMLLQKGEYAGVRYLSEKTVNEFTKYQFPDNRRGLGFDKPALPDQKQGNACKSASVESYGHTGFTGTYFWVEPKENLIIIMLTNRVFPDAGNTKLTDMNIRTNLQQAVYDAIYKSRINK